MPKFITLQKTPYIVDFTNRIFNQTEFIVNVKKRQDMFQ